VLVFTRTSAKSYLRAAQEVRRSARAAAGLPDLSRLKHTEAPINEATLHQAFEEAAGHRQLVLGLGAIRGLELAGLGRERNRGEGCSER